MCEGSYRHTTALLVLNRTRYQICSLQLGKGSRQPVTFHPTREASPVGEDHERQPLSVEVIDGLRGLEGRVREPHLASLLDYLLGRRQTRKP